MDVDSDAGLAAARRRVEAVYAAVDKLGPRGLDAVAVAIPDPEERAARVRRLESVAAATGRTALLDEARETLERELLERWTSHLDLAYGAESTMTGRANDRVAIVTALRDLVGVAVMRDRLAPEDADALSEPGLVVLGAATPWVAPIAGAGPDPVGAPTAEEWAAAAGSHETGPTQAWHPEPVPIVIGVLAGIALVVILVSQLAN